jgi:putative hemolysin
LDQELPIWISFFLLFILFLIFSVLERAYASLNRFTLKRVARGASRRLAAIDRLFRAPYQIAATLNLSRQLLIASLAISSCLLAFNLPSPFFWFLPLLFIFLLVFFIGQLLPRVLASSEPERVFFTLFPFFLVSFYILYPFALPLSKVARAVDEKRRKRVGEEGETISEEQLRAFLAVGEREGLIEKDEEEMIQSVVDLGDKIAREVMTPRIDMVSIKSDASLAEFRKLITRTKFSRIPVYRERIDQIEGVAYSKDLLDRLDKDLSKPRVSEIMHPTFFIPETKKLDDLLRELQKRRVHLAVVVDEYGGTSGIITIEDILEELVGEIRDEHEEEEEGITEEKDGSLILSGKQDVEELGERLNLRLDEGDYETVGGLVFDVLGKVPKKGESFTYRGLRFEVVDVDERRILKLRIRKLPSNQDMSP